MNLTFNDILLPFFIPSRKCGLMGMAAINAAGSIASSSITNGVNYKMNKETNESNERNVAATNAANLEIANRNNDTQIQLAQEANDLNYQMFKEGNAFNEYMWDKENDYNDPANQLKRLIEAGINPNMVAGSNGGNNPTGTAGSAPSSVSFSPAVVPNLVTPNFEAAIANPYEMLPPVLDFLGPMMQAAGIEETRAKTKGMEISNQMHEFELEQLPTNMYLEQDLKKWQVDSVKASIFKYNASGMLDLQKISESDATAYFQMQAANLASKQAEECEQRIAFAKEMHPKQLRNLDAQWSEIMSQIKENEANAAAAYGQAAANFAQAEYTGALTTGVDIDNQTRHEQNLANVRQANAGARYTQMLSITEGTKWSKAEKEAVASFLADNPTIKPSTIVNALKDVRSMPEKELRSKYGASVARFAIGVVTGVAVGAATANPVLGLGAGAAVAGAPMGAVVNPSMGQPKPNPIGFTGQ